MSEVSVNVSDELNEDAEEDEVEVDREDWVEEDSEDEGEPAEAKIEMAFKCPVFNKDIQEVQDFKTFLDNPDLTEVRGVKKLRNTLKNYLYHLVPLPEVYASMQKTLAYCNGERTTVQYDGDKTRSLRRVSLNFYNKLNTEGLRMQCNLFKLDYNSYESIDDVVNALVNKTMEFSGVV
jgi:hypothetical protein